MSMLSVPFSAFSDSTPPELLNTLNLAEATESPFSVISASQCHQRFNAPEPLSTLSSAEATENITSQRCRRFTSLLFPCSRPRARRVGTGPPRQAHLGHSLLHRLSSLVSGYRR